MTPLIGRLLKLKKGDIVLVEWLDPQTNPGWITEYEKLSPVQTVGIFMGEDTTTLWLGSSYHKGHDAFCDELIFPKRCITNLKVIKELIEYS